MQVKPAKSGRESPPRKVETVRSRVSSPQETTLPVLGRSGLQERIGSLRFKEGAPTESRSTR